jgi:hypothetical protein
MNFTSFYFYGGEMFKKIIQNDKNVAQIFDISCLKAYVAILQQDISWDAFCKNESNQIFALVQLDLF